MGAIKKSGLLKLHVYENKNKVACPFYAYHHGWRRTSGRHWHRENVTQEKELCCVPCARKLILPILRTYNEDLLKTRYDSFEFAVSVRIYYIQN